MSRDSHEISESTKLTLDLKTIGLIIGGAVSIATVEGVQSDVNTIKEDIQEIKEQLKKMDERLYQMTR